MTSWALPLKTARLPQWDGLGSPRIETHLELEDMLGKQKTCREAPSKQWSVKKNWLHFLGPQAEETSYIEKMEFIDSTADAEIKEKDVSLQPRDILGGIFVSNSRLTHCLNFVRGSSWLWWRELNRKPTCCFRCWNCKIAPGRQDNEGPSNLVIGSRRPKDDTLRFIHML